MTSFLPSTSLTPPEIQIDKVLEKAISAIHNMFCKVSKWNTVKKGGDGGGHKAYKAGDEPAYKDSVCWN